MNAFVQNDIRTETEYRHLLLLPSLFLFPELLASPFFPDLQPLRIHLNRIYIKFTKPHFTKMRMGINLFSAGGHKDETIGHAPRH